MEVSKIIPELISKKNNIKILNNITDYKKNNLILLLSNKNTDLETLCNNKLINMSNYESVYIPKYMNIPVTESFNKKYVIAQKDYYEKLKNRTHFNKFHKHIEQYNGLNLVYDFGKFAKIIQSNTRIIGTGNILSAINKKLVTDVLNLEYVRNNYKNIHMLIPLDNNISMLDGLLNSISKVKTAKNIKIYKSRLKNEKNIYNTTIALSLMLFETSNILKDYNINYIFYSSKDDLILRINNKVLNRKRVLTSLTTILKVANYNKNELSADEKEVLNSVKDNKERKNDNLNKLKDINKTVEQRLSDAISKIFKDRFSITGETNDDITTIEILKDSIKNDDNLTDQEIQHKINTNEEIRKHLRKIMSTRTVGEMTDVELSILRKSRDKFANTKFKIYDEELTVDEILKKYEEIQIEDEKIEHVNLVNEDLKSPKLLNFDKSYIKKMFELDLFRIFASVDRNTEHPLVLIDLNKKDTSDELNHKYTYTAKYKDKHNKTINLKIDIPIILENAFLLLNGTKKSVAKQIFSMPVTKTSEHETYLSTNYKKMRFNKVGKNINPVIIKFNKAVKTENMETLSKYGITLTFGDNIEANKEYMSNIEYSTFASKFMNIKIKNTFIIFNRKKLDDVLSKLEFPQLVLNKRSTKFPIGYNKKTQTVYYIDVKDNNVYYSKNGELGYNNLGNLTKFIIDMIDLNTPSDYDFLREVAKQPVGKVFTYSIVTVMGRKIPTIAIVSSYSNFINVLDKMNINYELSTTRKKLSYEDTLKYRMIRFKDFYMYYEATPASELLLNGLYPINTEDYNFEDLTDNMMFDDYYERVFRLRHLGKSIRIMLHVLIDPITDDILKDHTMPTDILDLILYSNITLTSLEFTEKSNMKLYRIKPSAEIIASHLYSVIMDSYIKYVSSNTRIPFSVKQDAVIKSLLSDKLIETYSVLNPFRELQAQSKATWRGKGGINQDRAYQMNIRKYSKSMAGVLGMYSPNNGNVGIIRTLTHNPKLLNIRGYINLDNIPFDGGNLLSPTELLHSFASAHSDPSRQNMIVMQSEALMPTKNTTKPLMGSGMSVILPYISGNDFSFVAKDDGVVKDVDETNGVILISYNNGYDDIIDISDKIDKNSSSGFFISNKLSHNLKVGQNFKKNDILAKNSGYYKDSMLHGPQFSMGTMGKVAMISQDTAVEDASIITRNFADRLSSDVIMEVDVEVDTNTNILKMVKIGDHVNIADPLVVFETVFDDKDIINMLDKLDDDIKERLTDYSFDVKKSKYNGTIVDVKMFYTREIEDFTPSVQKIIKRYISRVKQRRKKIDSGNYEYKPNITTPRTDKYDKMRITTKEIDGLLIKLYISHEDHIKIGDKIAYQTAIKTIISEIIGYGEEPFTEFRKDENIDAFFSPLSVVSRMTMDIFNFLYGNKVLIELKRQIKGIYK